MKKTAIILGATGLTGSILLEKLLEDDRYESIKLFGRREIDGLPPKVHQYVGDLLVLEDFKNDFTADEVYCCIGTTAKKKTDKQRYKEIDFGIPVAAAKLAKANGISTYIAVSALGANPKSSIFYNKIKGEMEQEVASENIKKTHIMQPSFIDGERDEQRLGEKIGILVFQLIQPLFFGKLKKYRITQAKDLAEAMIQLANLASTQLRITSQQIESLAKAN